MIVKINKALYISHVRSVRKIHCEEGNPVDWVSGNCHAEVIFLWPINENWVGRTY